MTRAETRAEMISALAAAVAMPSRAELFAELEALEAERDALLLDLDRVRGDLEWTAE